MLSPEMRHVWPILGQATSNLDGCLMGGTALAVYLRHRRSFDLDYMTAGSFSGDRLAKKFQKAAGHIDVHASGTDQLKANVLGAYIPD